MRPSVLFLFCLALACGAAQKPFDAESARQSLRVIAACVLIDAEHPVEERFVRDTFAEAAAQLERETGIALVVDGSGDYEGGLGDWPFGLARALAKRCPARVELRFVFSDLLPKVKEFDASGSRIDSDPDVDMAGLTEQRLGIVIVFNASTNAVFKNLGGEPILLGTLKHEIGHLFDLEHDPGTDSFMHAPSAESFSAWTPAVRAAFLRNKWKRWPPPPPPSP